LTCYQIRKFGYLSLVPVPWAPYYYAGLHGKDVIESIYPQIEPERWERILRLYQRFGRLPLLIASIPIVGTLLTVGAGMAGISRNSFLFWVAVSKVIRNWILIVVFWRLL
jgi:membrane protein YqaA with SNARE-associated domain